MDKPKFKNLYRIDCNRYREHDYNGGWYFITIVTKNRQHYFGEIKNGEMTFSAIGIFVFTVLQNYSNICPHVEIPIFVVMPNHIHLIVEIRKDTAGDTTGDTTGDTAGAVSQQAPSQRKFQSFTKLSVIIRGIKSFVTKHANENNIPFMWQPNYHDRIIRNQQALNNIAKYIEENPIRWGKKNI